MTETMEIPQLSDDEFDQITDDLITAGLDLGYDILDPDLIFGLTGQYLAWKQFGVFASESGLSLIPVDKEEKPPHLVMPKEFGYKPAPNDYMIHFLPPHYSKDEKNEVVPKDSDQPTEGQKYLKIRNGLMGSMEYIFLVEAGLIPRPDNIIGVTNPTMARFAQRAGLKTADSLAEQPVNDPDEMHEVLELTDEKINRKAKKFFDGDMKKPEIRELLPWLVKCASFYKKIGKRKKSQDLVWLANRFMLNDRSRSQATVVWGSYEDFRDGVLEFESRFGDRVLRLAGLELSAVGASE